MYWYTKGVQLQAVGPDLSLEAKAQRIQVRTFAEIRLVLDKLEDRMRLLGYTSRDIFAVRLASTEALVNAIRHGNRRDPSKDVRVNYLVSPTEVLVEVQDEGPGFDLQAVPDPLTEKSLDRPGGRGLFLMRVYTSWLCFNERGNRVTFCKVRTGT
jgi:serine/threonine-protein kinase RsbW